MNIEENRLHTFATWPASAPVESGKIAKAGFFYTGEKLVVECFACGDKIDDWEYGDSAITRHMRLNSNCPFIANQLTSGNVPYVPSATPSTSTTVSSTVTVQKSTNIITELADQKKHNDVVPERSGVLYTTLEDRLASYDGWPDNASQSPRSLAEAGFYYTGSGDFVRCFICDGGLTNWEPHDDPIQEHTRCFANCPFLVRRRQRQLSNSISNDARVNAAMENEITQAALSAGIEPGRIQDAIRHRIEQDGASFVNIEELMDALFDDRGASANFQAPLARAFDRTSIVARAIPRPTLSEPLTVEDENRRLREARLCKICLDKELGVVFLPCGHFAACENCAANLELCPLCRAKIDISVKTFLP